MNSINISIIGAGGFGLALANTFSNKYNVCVWVHSKNNYEELSSNYQSSNYLKAIKLNSNISFTMDIKEAIEDKNIIIVSTPSFAFEDTCLEIAKYIKENQIILITTKGLQIGTALTMSEVAKKYLPKNIDILTLSGPSHAEELADKKVTAVVIAGKAEVAQKVRDLLIMPPFFRIYSSTDQIGVEIGGALKNIIAVAGGIAQGLKLGDNAKAALITRGLAEIVRFAIFKGAKENTLFGLSGIGDLIVTSSSALSRNNRLGFSLAMGKTYDEVIKENHGQVAEGAYAAKAVYGYAKKNNIEMPITETIYNIIYNNHNVHDAVIDLMSRDAKDETL